MNKCPKCGHEWPAKNQAKGGKNRWKGMTKKFLEDMMNLMIMMLQEVGNRSDSLVDAILEASRIDHENKICLTAEGIFWECQKLIEEETLSINSLRYRFYRKILTMEQLSIKILLTYR
jgi:hypothetical protein